MKKAFLLIVLILTATCSSNNNPAAPPQAMNGPNPCTVNHNGQNGPGGAPIVCIDYQRFDAGTQPSPDPIHAWQADAVQFWFYNVGSAQPQLTLQFAPETQARVMTPVCRDLHCTVIVLPGAMPDTQARKYSITDTVSGKHLDPDILIEP